jgi:hypothetical protein
MLDFGKVQDVLCPVSLVGSEKTDVVPAHGLNPTVTVKFQKRLLIGLQGGSDRGNWLISEQITSP